MSFQKLIGQKIRECREKTGMNQAELGMAAFGYNESERNAAQTKITKIESGKQELKITELISLVRVLKINLDDFLEYTNIGMGNIPIFYSNPIPVIDWNQSDIFAEAKDLWHSGFSLEGEPVYSHKKVGSYAFALEVKGDSMSPRFNEGDIIIIDPELEVASGQYCLARLRSEITFKLFINQEKEYRLIPLNPSYEDLVIPKNRSVDFQLIGPVVDAIPKLP